MEEENKNINDSKGEPKGEFKIYRDLDNLNLQIPGILRSGPNFNFDGIELRESDSSPFLYCSEQDFQKLAGFLANPVSVRVIFKNGEIIEFQFLPRDYSLVFSEIKMEMHHLKFRDNKNINYFDIQSLLSLLELNDINKIVLNSILKPNKRILIPDQLFYKLDKAKIRYLSLKEKFLINYLQKYSEQYVQFVASAQFPVFYCVGAKYYPRSVLPLLFNSLSIFEGALFGVQIGNFLLIVKKRHHVLFGLENWQDSPCDSILLWFEPRYFAAKILNQIHVWKMKMGSDEIKKLRDGYWIAIKTQQFYFGYCENILDLINFDEHVESSTLFNTSINYTKISELIAKYTNQYEEKKEENEIKEEKEEEKEEENEIKEEEFEVNEEKEEEKEEEFEVNEEKEEEKEEEFEVNEETVKQFSAINRYVKKIEQNKRNEYLKYIKKKMINSNPVAVIELLIQRYWGLYINFLYNLTAEIGISIEPDPVLSIINRYKKWFGELPANQLFDFNGTIENHGIDEHVVRWLYFESLRNTVEIPDLKNKLAQLLSELPEFSPNSEFYSQIFVILNRILQSKNRTLIKKAVENFLTLNLQLDHLETELRRLEVIGAQNTHYFYETAPQEKIIEALPYVFTYHFIFRAIEYLYQREYGDFQPPLAQYLIIQKIAAQFFPGTGDSLSIRAVYKIIRALNYTGHFPLECEFPLYRDSEKTVYPFFTGEGNIITYTAGLPIPPKIVTLFRESKQKQLLPQKFNGIGQPYEFQAWLENQSEIKPTNVHYTKIIAKNNSPTELDQYLPPLQPRFDRLLAKYKIDTDEFFNLDSDSADKLNKIPPNEKVNLIIPQAREFGACSQSYIRTLKIYGGNLFSHLTKTEKAVTVTKNIDENLIMNNINDENEKNLLLQWLEFEKGIAEWLLAYHELVKKYTKAPKNRLIQLAEWVVLGVLGPQLLNPDSRNIPWQDLECELNSIIALISEYINKKINKLDTMFKNNNISEGNYNRIKGKLIISKSQIKRAIAGKIKKILRYKPFSGQISTAEYSKFLQIPFNNNSQSQSPTIKIDKIDTSKLSEEEKKIVNIISNSDDSETAFEALAELYNKKEEEQNILNEEKKEKKKEKKKEEKKEENKILNINIQNIVRAFYLAIVPKIPAELRNIAVYTVSRLNTQQKCTTKFFNLLYSAYSSISYSTSSDYKAELKKNLENCIENLTAQSLEEEIPLELVIKYFNLIKSSHVFEIKTAVKNLGAAWTDLSDFLSRLSKLTKNYELFIASRIAREQSKRPFLLGPEKNPTIYTVFENFKISGGVRQPVNFSDYIKIIKNKIKSITGFAEEKKNVKISIKNLKIAYTQYAKSINNPANVNFSAKIYKIVARLYKIQQFLNLLKESKENLSKIKIIPLRLQSSQIRLYKRALRNNQSINTKAQPSQISQKSLFEKMKKRDVSKINGKLFIELLESENLLSKSYNRILKLKANSSQTKKIEEIKNYGFPYHKILGYKIDSTALSKNEINSIIENFVKAGPGLLDLSDASNEGSFVTNDKFVAFKNLLEFKLTEFNNITVLEYLNRINDSALALDAIKIELFGEINSEISKELLLDKNNESIFYNFVLLNQKIGTSKITQFESMCNRLLSFDLNTQANILKSEDIPDCFIPIVGPIKYTTKNIMLFFTKPDSKSQDDNSNNTLYAIAVIPAKEKEEKKEEGKQAEYYIIIQPVHKRSHPMLDVRDGFELINEFLQIQRESTNTCWFYYDGKRSAPSLSLLFSKLQKILTYAAAVEYRDSLSEPHVFPLIPLSVAQQGLIQNLINNINTIIQNNQNINNKLLDKIKKILDSLSGTRTQTKGPGYSRFLSRDNWSILKSIYSEIPERVLVNLSVAADLLNQLLINLYEGPSDQNILKISNSDTIYSVLVKLFELLKNDSLYYKINNEYILLDKKYATGFIFLSQFPNKDKKQNAIIDKLSDFIDLVKQIGYQLSQGSVLDSEFNLPFGTPTIQISSEGRLFVDVPLYFYDWMPPKDSSFAHPYVVSLGADAGRRDYLTIAITQSNKPIANPIIAEAFNSEKALHRTKAARVERENFNRSKINRYVNSRWRKISHAKSSGRRQANRLKQLNRSVVYKSAVKLVESVNSAKQDIQNFAKDIVSKFYKSSDIISSFEYLNKCGLPIPDRLYRWYSRMVFENLSGFNAPGGDVFSSSWSKSTSWSGVGELKKCAMELCENLGISLRFVPPNYTSKMSCFSKIAPDEPSAVAGWLVSVNSDQNSNKLRIYPPPVQFIHEKDLTNYIQECDKNSQFREYTVSNNRLIGETPISKGLMAKLVVLSAGNHYVEIESGKWVRVIKNKEKFYIDRDINAALNLSQYNEFEWQNQLCALMKYRLKNKIHPIRSKRTYNSARDRASFLDKLYSQYVKDKQIKKGFSYSDLSDYLLLLSSNWRPPDELT